MTNDETQKTVNQKPPKREATQAEKDKAEKIRLENEAIKKRISVLKARLQKNEAKEKAEERKADAREKLLIGVAFKNDVLKKPELKTTINETLKRGITRKDEIEFLQSRGWLL
jgi:hypothetical protein